MPNPSARLGLLVPARTDPFVTGDIATNWDTIDAHPGTYICTSTTRPPTGNGPGQWGVQQAGMEIAETDTGLKWRWDGAAWQRASPKGLMARATSATTLTTTSTAFAIPATTGGTGGIMATPVVTWPAGGRTAMLTLTFNFAYNNTTGVLCAAIARGIVNNAGLIQAWQLAGDNDGSGGSGTKGSGTTLVCYDTNLGPGSYQWSVQIKAANISGGNSGGTATMSASGAGSIALTVIEV